MGVAEDVLRDYRASQVASLPDPAGLRTGVEPMHLEAALALGRYGNARRATEALGMKRATLNRRIRDLEFLLGTPLFERGRRGAVPTRLGAIFLRHAARTLGDLSLLVASIRRLADGKAGDIAIGYCGGIAGARFAALLFPAADTRAAFRTVPVALAPDRLFDTLAAGGVDLALCLGDSEAWPGGFGAARAALWSERLVLALAPHHRLAQQPVLRWSDLAGESFLVAQQGPIPNAAALIAARLAPHGGPGPVTTHAVGAGDLLHLVAAGQGIGLGLAPDPNLDSSPGPGLDPASGSAGLARAGRVVLRDLLTPQGPEQIEAFLCWHDTCANAALGPFLRQLARRYPAIATTGALCAGARPAGASPADFSTAGAPLPGAPVARTRLAGVSAGPRPRNGTGMEAAAGAPVHGGADQARAGRAAAAAGRVGADA